MDIEVFRNEINTLNQPTILGGLAGSWPAVKAARRSDESLCDYLAGHATDDPVNVFFGAPGMDGRYFYNSDLRGFNFERRQLPLEDFLALLLKHAGDEHPPSFYAGAVPVPKHAPGVLAENRHGLLDESVEQLVSLWIGDRSRTAAHFDLAQNIACVISGRRRFILLPIEQIENLYMGPLDLTPAGQAISLVDFLEPDFDAHPRFAEAARHAVVAELEPGDALYIPSLWFHHVETLSPVGAMVNFWWRDAPEYMFTPMITLMHSLLSLRDLPERERKAWRVVFDHYIFQSGGDPMAHLPMEARGIFGELTPERLQSLRRYLGQSLGFK